MPEPFPIGWVPREVPLAPVAVVGRGPVARLLLARLRALPDDRLARLEGGTAESLTIVMGKADDLPWVDGVTYLGREPAAADLVVPTTSAAAAPAALVEAALRRQATRTGAAFAGPFAVLLDPLTIVPLASLRRIDRAALEG